MRTFIIFLTPPRPTFASDANETERDAVSRHFSYLSALTESGTVIMAGRCAAPDGAVAGPGLVVFQAPDEAAAQRVMLDDPAVAEGVFRAELKPFSVALLSRKRTQTSAT